MRLKTIYILIFGLVFPFAGMAQTDSIVKRFKKEFNTFNQTIQQKNQLFREKNDSLFSQFLKDSWASFDVLYKGKPSESKPVLQPKVEQQIKEISVPNKEILIDSTKTGNLTKPIESEQGIWKKEQATSFESNGTAILNVDFYGNESKLSFPSAFPQIKQISTESISAYYTQTCNSPSILKLVSELLSLKEKLRLNDWGYFKLVESCARQIESEPSSRKLLTWVILIKSGFNAKTGFSGNKVFVLLPFCEELFNNYYIDINGQAYYISSDDVKAEEIRQMTVYKADYPGNNLFSLMIAQLPVLGDKTVSREFNFRETILTIHPSEQLNNFYREYPMCELKVYFSTPLSETVLNSLENYFKPLFTGLTDKEKVAILLEFTQKAFSYQSDQDQFGREKYFFPDELFFYPFSDCEDRAVLFSRLVKHFTRLNCVALDYPGHFNTAINFGEETRGTFITVKGMKYIVCDPTYINAPIGYLPEEFKGLMPKVITFD